MAARIHGYTTDGRAIIRDGGWWLKQPGSGEATATRVTCAQAATEALRTGNIIFGVEGGAVFEKHIRQQATLPEFDHFGISPVDAVAQARNLDQNGFWVCQLRNLPTCLEVAGEDQIKVHISKASGMWHTATDCQHATASHLKTTSLNQAPA